MFKSVVDPKPKCHFTHFNLPAYVDHAQPPMKKRPFSTIQGQVFNHTLHLLLPATKADSLRDSLQQNGNGTLHYATVYMKLTDIILGDFFHQYIKSTGSNILMLSPSRPGQDNAFSLHEGILRLEVEKATFERMGLEGKVIPSEGRKHIKARHAVEINLRLPSMVRGKNGFERIHWAFRNVLNQSIEWLFCDLKGGDLNSGAIATHSPIVHNSEYRSEDMVGVRVPHFHLQEGDGGEETDDDDEYPTALLEWLTLALMDSPRIRESDNTDTALSRYQIPSSTVATSEQSSLQDLVHFQWHGLIPAQFIRKILLDTLKATAGEDWFAVQAKAFDGNAYAFVQKGLHTMTWEYEDRS